MRCDCDRWSLLMGMMSISLVSMPLFAEGRDEPPVVAEPSLADLLERRWGLHAERDLRNPQQERVHPAAVFRRVDPDRPVTLKPLIALGSDRPTHAGWYPTPPRADHLPRDTDASTRKKVWSFAYASPPEKSFFGGSAPRLTSGEPMFDPGPGTFSLWVACESSVRDGRMEYVHLHPGLNRRNGAGDHRAKIYPARNQRTGNFAEHTYLVAWDVSGTGAFHELIIQIGNVEMLPAHPAFPGLLSENARVRKVAEGFQSPDGPAWNPLSQALYFTDLSKTQVLRWTRQQVYVSTEHSHGAIGLMVDSQGRMLSCESHAQRIARTTAGGITTTLVSHIDGKPLSTPRDLWLDQRQGVYFTHFTDVPSQLTAEQEQSVLYVSGKGIEEARVVVGGLARPAGLAISPDGRMLYVADAGSQEIRRYRILSPGVVAKGERIAHVAEPGGMTMDEEGRLYIAGRGGVWVLDRHGLWIGIIETLEHPRNCTFGGEKNNALFITAGKSLYRVDMRTRGWHLHRDGTPPRFRPDWDLVTSK